MNDETVNDKLARTLTNSRAGNTEALLRLIRYDVFAALSQYMDLRPEDLLIHADVHLGGITVSMTARAAHIFEVGNLAD